MGLELRNGKAAQRESFWPGYPADVQADTRADVPAQNAHPIAWSAGK